MITLKLPEQIQLFTDAYLMALCLWREARGEPMEGKIAVAQVIMNRTKNPAKWDGTDVYSVITAQKQFSSFNLAEVQSVKFPRGTDTTWKDCLDAALQVLSGEKTSLVGNADHYFTTAKPAYATVWPPKWSEKMKEVAKVGGHTFVKATE